MNGARQITVIDGTHFDLTGLAFGACVATAAMQDATAIDTDANLRKHLNTVALRSNAAGANTQSPVANVTPAKFAMQLPGLRVVLSPMNAPNSVRPGCHSCYLEQLKPFLCP